MLGFTADWWLSRCPDLRCLQVDDLQCQQVDDVLPPLLAAAQAMRHIVRLGNLMVLSWGNCCVCMTS